MYDIIDRLTLPESGPIDNPNPVIDDKEVKVQYKTLTISAGATVTKRTLVLTEPYTEEQFEQIANGRHETKHLIIPDTTNEDQTIYLGEEDKGPTPIGEVVTKTLFTTEKEQLVVMDRELLMSNDLKQYVKDFLTLTHGEVNR